MVDEDNNIIESRIKVPMNSDRTLCCVDETPGWMYDTLTAMVTLADGYDHISSIDVEGLFESTTSEVEIGTVHYNSDDESIVDIELDEWVIDDYGEMYADLDVEHTIESVEPVWSVGEHTIDENRDMKM